METTDSVHASDDVEAISSADIVQQIAHEQYVVAQERCQFVRDDPHFLVLAIDQVEDGLIRRVWFGDDAKTSVAESVVQKQLEYYNNRDVDGFVSTYAEDIEVFDLPNGRDARLAGMSAFESRYRGSFKKKTGGQL